MKNERLLDMIFPLLARVFSRAGRDAVTKVLQLYYLARSPDVPALAKATVFAALTYFVLTPDAVPDLAPVIGFVDDLAVLTSALAGLVMYITPDIQNKVQDHVVSWFGDDMGKSDENSDGNKTTV